MTPDLGYSHTQKAPLCLILYGSALICFAMAWMVGSAPGNIIAVAVGTVIALLGPAFHHLTVEDQGDLQNRDHVVQCGALVCISHRRLTADVS